MFAKLYLQALVPGGGQGISDVVGLTYRDILKGYLTFRDPKFYLFFTQTVNGKNAARQFLKRLKERKEKRDTKTKFRAFRTQLKAIYAWGHERPADLSVVKQPVLIANGDHDRMVPTPNSYDMAKRFPNSELVIYDDAGHGGIFQNHEDFVKIALAFYAK